MAVGERIKDVRLCNNMSLEKFGQKLGVSKVAISLLENGKNKLTDQMALSICREYNVNYDWLIHGTGEMFNNIPQTILDELCLEYDCDDIDRNLISEYLKLDATGRKILKDYMRNVFCK